MADEGPIRILAEPLQPSSFGRCEKCRRWFSMELIHEENTTVSGKVRTFRCKHCGHEETFASRHPPGAV